MGSSLADEMWTLLVCVCLGTLRDNIGRWVAWRRVGSYHGRALLGMRTRQGLMICCSCDLELRTWHEIELCWPLQSITAPAV